MFRGKRSAVSRLVLGHLGWAICLSVQREHLRRSKPNPGLLDKMQGQARAPRREVTQSLAKVAAVLSKRVWALGKTSVKPRERLTPHGWKRNPAPGRPRNGLFPKPLKLVLASEFLPVNDP